ncbi:hypothetical protein ABZ114_02835 [Streptomyces albidoflavus]|uniref:collagen-like triple helix repeat-containing protein n=1 Tax=Streptomyces albidoflavus TaxID=1886 RepID=UPI0033B16AC4
MGLSVWPAPEDSGVVGPTGATGPKGDVGATGAKGATGSTGAKGDTGPTGKSVLQGVEAPAASLGADGDVYLQKTENTFLGVTSATVAVYVKAAGVWSKVGTDLRGAAWYVNSGSTSSAETKPGDMLLNTSTGALYQRSASGWGASIGTLKGDVGATGATGATGAQGPKGDPGGVSTVNGKAGTVVLAAMDVNALPIAGGTVTGTVDVRPTSGNSFSAYGSTAPSTYFRVTADGHPYSNSERATFYNIGVGDTSTPFGGGVRVLGMQNASVVPTTNPSNGVVAYAQGGVMKVRQADGQVITIGSQPELPSVWEPEDLGLKAWAYDPAVSHSVPMYCGTTPRLAAVKLNKRTSITKIVWHFGGYAGGLISGSWAAIYDAATMVRVGNATTIEAGNEPAEQHGSGGNASATALDAAVTLDPGVYYVVWRFNYNTTTGDGPMILGIENSYGGPANTFGLNNLWRYGRLTTSPTTSPSPLSGIANESNRFWVALA